LRSLALAACLLLSACASGPAPQRSPPGPMAPFAQRKRPPAWTYRAAPYGDSRDGELPAVLRRQGGDDPVSAGCSHPGVVDAL